MIGMTGLLITSTSNMLLKDLNKAYKVNDIISKVSLESCNFRIHFPTTIYNEEKEGVFATIIEKIKHLKDPQDKLMETKVEARYLQQASKEYFFSCGELVRYRGFIDTDNPLPMVTKLVISLDS